MPKNISPLGETLASFHLVLNLSVSRCGSFVILPSKSLNTGPEFIPKTSPPLILGSANPTCSSNLYSLVDKSSIFFVKTFPLIMSTQVTISLFLPLEEGPSPR